MPPSDEEPGSDEAQHERTGDEDDTREPSATPLADPDPDHAWKALNLVNEWIKHAETKAIATLASAGVCGGVLFNLIRNSGSHSTLNFSMSAVAAALIIVAGVSAGLCLVPRLRTNYRRTSTTSPLYFADIARQYSHDLPTYADLLFALTSEPETLVRHIAHQVHANAQVARRKYRWANVAMSALLGALLALGATAFSL